MKYEWKTGDKLIVVNAVQAPSGEPDTGLEKNEIVTADQDVATDYDSSSVYVITSTGYRGSYWPYRFRKLTEQQCKVFPKHPKPLPIEKHVIVQDSCGNFIAFRNNKKDAIEYAKTYNKETLTIYKMVEVAKITTERKVTETTKKTKKS